MRSFARLSVLLLALPAIVGLFGCAHYQLGIGAKPKFATLYIAPVTSDVLLPQSQALITTQLRDAFVRDGRVALADSADTADAVLRVNLTSYAREVAVVRPDDTGLARRFDINLRAVATLTDTRTKQVLFEKRPLAVKRGAFTDSGQLQSEYQLLPLLAAQLADDTLHAVLDTW